MKKLEINDQPEEWRDKGGRILPKKVWRVFYFITQIAVESPGDIDEEEAAEDAAEFMTHLSATAGRVHSSYASFVRVDEAGMLRPLDCPVIIREPPKGEQVELELPRGIEKKKDYEKKKPKKGTKKPIKKKGGKRV